MEIRQGRGKETRRFSIGKDAAGAEQGGKPVRKSLQGGALRDAAGNETRLSHAIPFDNGDERL